MVNFCFLHFEVSTFGTCACGVNTNSNKDRKIIKIYNLTKITLFMRLRFYVYFKR